MKSDDVLNFEQLLQLIPGDNPAGVDLKQHDEGSLYYLIIKAPRDSSSDMEKKFYDSTGAERDDKGYSLANCQWDEVMRQSIAVLGEKSKDIDIASWLCEALIREEGYPGLRDGFRLIREFAQNESIWENCYPEQEDDSYARRVRMLRGLIEGERASLKHPIQNVPLTEGNGFTKLQYDNADRLRNVLDESERKAVVGGLEDVKITDFLADVNSSSDEFARRLAGDLESCIDELKQLWDTLGECCGQDEIGQPVAPSARSLIETLESVLKIVQEIYGDRLNEPVTGELVADDGNQLVEGDGAVTAAGGGVDPNQALTREKAFDLMNRLAGFFEKTEPSSPAAMQLRKTMRIGSMTLPEILAEAIEDKDMRANAFLRLGIDPPEEEG